MECTNQTQEQYLCVYCNYQQDNWADLLLLAEFAYNNALSATTGISPFFANKGYHPNISIHLECDLTSTHARELQLTLMNSIKNSRNKSLLHNIAINFQLMPDNLQLQTSRLETKSTSMLNSYALHVHPKNSPTRMLVHTRLLPSLAHIPLPFDFWIACVPSIWSFTYHSWNLHPQVPSLTKYQLCHLQSSLRANWSSRSLKSLTPKLIAINTFASYCT